MSFLIATESGGWHGVAEMTKGARLLNRWFEKHPETSERALAMKLGISNTAIARWRKGEVVPHLEWAGRLEKEVDIPMSAWMEETTAKAVRR